MIVEDESRHIDDACPKQAWVMSILSSDEAWDVNDELPQGLRFHLSQCDRCRKLAESMLAVTGGLHALSQDEPPADLGDRANGQLAEALEHGARLTGRVDIPDEVETSPPAATWAWPRQLAPLALAASIVLMASLLWFQPSPERPQPMTDPQHLADALATIQPIVEADPEADLPLPPGEGRGQGQTAIVKAEVETDERIAEAEEESPPARRRRRPICRDQSYIEAALSEDVNCIPRAIVLPNPAERARWARTRAIDSAPHPVSTTRRPDPR